MNSQARSRPHHLHLSVRQILDMTHEGALALPEFQRPFIWEESKVRAFVATIIKGWPGGSLLLMEAPPNNFFALRPLEGAPPASLDTVRHLILDGQQRITAINEAFGEVGGRPFEWALDVNIFLGGPDDVEVIEDSLRRVPSSRKNRSAPSSHRNLLVPLTALRSTESFSRWRADALRPMLHEHDDLLDELLDNLWFSRLAHVAEFQLPTVVLDRAMELSAVAKIFERLNTSGVELDTFDLVVAHVYRDGRDLRSAWTTALTDRPVLSKFVSQDPQIAVELIALLTRGDTRRQSLLSLDASDVWSRWSGALDALEQACAFLATDLGVPKRADLPHRAFLLILAAQADATPLTHHAELIRVWFFSAALDSRFDAAVNTRLVRESKVLSAVIESRSAETIAQPSASKMASATRRGAASAWLAMKALLRSRGANTLNSKLIDVHEAMDLVSVSSTAGSTRSSDSVATAILLDQGDAGLVEGRGLRRLLDQIGKLEAREAEAFCESQLLPTPLDLRNITEQAFAEKRAQIIGDLLIQWRKLAADQHPGSGGSGLVLDEQRDALLEAATTALIDQDYSIAIDNLTLLVTSSASSGAAAILAGDAINLANAYLSAGNARRARRVLEDNLSRCENDLGVLNSDYLEMLDLLSDAQLLSGDYAAAIRTLKRLLDIVSSTTGADSRASLRVRTGLVRALILSGDSMGARAEWGRIDSILASTLDYGMRVRMAQAVVDGLRMVNRKDLTAEFEDFDILGPEGVNRVSDILP